MATRAQIRFATREVGVSFSDHPVAIHAQFYAHWDGYPEHRGVEIAESITKCKKIDGWEIESLHARHSDLEYVYYIWQHPMKDTWISIFVTRLLSVIVRILFVFINKLLWCTYKDTLVRLS